MHALIFCLQIWPSWLIHIPTMTHISRGMRIGDMARMFLSKKEPRQLGNFFMIVWSFWHRKSKWLYKNQCIHLSESINLALGLAKHYNTLPSTQMQQSRESEGWKPPAAGHLN